MGIENDTIDIENAMNEVADRIKVLSKNMCIGVIVQGFNEHTGEVTLSLQVVTPKLKHYSYRLIEASSKDFLERFPVNLKLFAKHPSNHQNASCKDTASLRSTLKDYSDSPITQLILNHLISLGALVDEYLDESIELTLNKNRLKDQFQVNNPNRPITLKKIILSSHFSSSENEWLKVVLGSQIKIRCSGFVNGEVIEHTIALISLVSPYHARPVFDLNLIFPSISEMNIFKNSATTTLNYEFELITNSEDVVFSLLVEKNTLKAH